jgi:hypothetical protein
MYYICHVLITRDVPGYIRHAPGEVRVRIGVR